MISGRAHSFIAYSLAIASVFAADTWMFPNVDPHSWMGGYLVPKSHCFTNNQDMVAVARIAPLLWHGHFLRRLLEVVFVHEYRRNATLGNCVFAWSSYLFYGIIISQTSRFDGLRKCAGASNSNEEDLATKARMLLGLLLFLIGEIGNAYSHHQLKWTRPTTSEDARMRANDAKATVWGQPEGKSIVKGGLFNYVTCAHFTYEMITWIGFAIFSNFTGGSQVLAIWSFFGLIFMAKPRHDAYVKYFGAEKYGNRKAIIPFLI